MLHKQTQKKGDFSDRIPDQGSCPRHSYPLILSHCDCRLIFNGGRILALTPQQFTEFKANGKVLTRGEDDPLSKHQLRRARA